MAISLSIEEGMWIQVQKLDIPDDGLEIWFRDFEQVKLFRTHLTPLHNTHRDFEIFGIFLIFHLLTRAARAGTYPAIVKGYEKSTKISSFQYYLLLGRVYNLRTTPPPTYRGLSAVSRR
jgi:hypothetical protein